MSSRDILWFEIHLIFQGRWPLNIIHPLGNVLIVLRRRAWKKCRSSIFTYGGVYGIMQGRITMVFIDAYFFLNYASDMILQVWIRKGHIVTNRLVEEQKVLRLEIQWNNCVWRTQLIITNVLTYNCYFSFLLKSFLLPPLLFGRFHIQKKAIPPVCDTTINKDKQTNKQINKQTKEKWFS